MSTVQCSNCASESLTARRRKKNKGIGCELKAARFQFNSVQEQPRLRAVSVSRANRPKKRGPNKKKAKPESPKGCVFVVVCKELRR